MFAKQCKKKELKTKSNKQTVKTKRINIREEKMRRKCFYFFFFFFFFSFLSGHTQDTRQERTQTTLE
jgi:hypothetical protein